MTDMKKWNNLGGEQQVYIKKSGFRKRLLLIFVKTQDVCQMSFFVIFFLCFQEKNYRKISIFPTVKMLQTVYIFQQKKS